jgi:hypothetical protein
MVPQGVEELVQETQRRQVSTWGYPLMWGISGHLFPSWVEGQGLVTHLGTLDILWGGLCFWALQRKDWGYCSVGEKVPSEGGERLVPGGSLSQDQAVPTCDPEQY